MATVRAKVVAVVGSLIAVGCLAAGSASAQNGQDGSIVGSVLDQAGTPLKGVKVTVSSETQIGGARSTYTNDEGNFRLPALQPGTFELRAAAPKLKAVVVKDVRVGISAPAEVNVVLEVETAVEEVKVVERAPIVNTTSAAIKDVIDFDMIEAMPLNSRDQPHNQLIGAVPGAVGRSVRGGTDSQTIFTQDGFDLREQFPTLKTSAAYEILSGGHAGDAPTALGGAVNLVTRSGSNKFEFEFNATMDSNNLRFFLDPGEAGNPAFTYVINPMVAGPILKDRLWYFANIETFIESTSHGVDPQGVFPNRTPELKTISKGMVKLTWQVTPRHRLSSLNNFDLPHEYRRKDDLGVEPEAQEDRIGRRLFTGLIWDGLLSDKVVIRSQAGVTYYGQAVYPEMCLEAPDQCDSIPSLIQTVPRHEESQNSGTHTREDTIDVQAVNRLEFFEDSKVLGDHAISLVSNFFTEQDTTYTSTPGDMITQFKGADPDTQTTYYSNDPRQDEARYGWYISRVDWRRHTGTIRDAWRPTRHLTLTPALSHVWAQASNSAGDTTVNSMAFVPSLTAAWDATHDGRTVLRASFGNYADVEVENQARHTLGGRVSRKCSWNDSTGKFDKSCTYSGGPSRNTFGLPCGPSGVDLTGVSCREPLGIPRSYEYTLGGEREVVSGIAISLDGIYRQFTHQWDTRETNRIWNASGTALDPLSGGYRNGRAQTVSDLGTPDYAQRRYMGVTFAVKKREGRMKVQAAYTWSKLYGADGGYGDNPAQDIYLWGPLDNDHRHEIKMLALYQLLPWLSTGIRYDYHSGMPYNRFFRNDVNSDFTDYRARLGTNPGTNINDPADDRALRLPDVQSFNVQVRANLMPLIKQRLELYVDVLNALALRTTTAVTQDDTTAFGLPSGRSSPFRIRLGLNYRY
jgi:hypothetical protein